MIKIDLHVHSRYSLKPSNWILRQLGVLESYTTPKQVYATALERGMTHVTITDHDSIEGCLEIGHLPNTSMSCEVVARFPRDNCKVHVLCYGLTEEKYRATDALKANIYELVTYLRQNKVWHGLAHPLCPVDKKLAQAHIEQLLVLFELFELSGACSAQTNDTLKSMVKRLTRAELEALAEKHHIDEPKLDPDGKNFICGSDDYSGLFVARSYTANPGETIDALFLQPSENQVCLKDAKPADLAYSTYSIGYQYLQEETGIDRWIPFDSGLRKVASFLNTKGAGHNFPVDSIASWYAAELPARRTRHARSVLMSALRALPKPSGPLTPDNVSAQWFEGLSVAINANFKSLFEDCAVKLRKRDMLGLVDTLGSFPALYLVFVPYYTAYRAFQDTRLFSERLTIGCQPSREPKVAHFTDTFYEINGMALTLQEIASWAKKLNLAYTFVTCAHERSRFGEKVFPPLASFIMPEYPELKLVCPPILEILNYCYEEDFTHIHVATPGPTGMLGLLAAKLLRRPLYVTHHTAYAQYVAYSTGDQNFEQFARVYIRWFYNMADRVFVPSRAAQDELIADGVKQEKIVLEPRGIDTERFTPGKRGLHPGYRLLYVGRISREKNLEVLANAVKLLSRPDVSLTLVGDGPFRTELEGIVHGFNVEFRGYLTGEDLLNAYRQADIFVFPSTTDTFGNVILEAHACGLPTIVTDVGGPQDNVINGETGLIIEGGDALALKSAIESLLDKERLSKMGARARELAQKRSFDKALLGLWEFYRRTPEDARSNLK